MRKDEACNKHDNVNKLKGTEFKSKTESNKTQFGKKSEKCRLFRFGVLTGPIGYDELC
jgi:hypothetical protein